MERTILQELKDWKTSAMRKPLVLEGARQVGKTWVMQEFGKREYKHTAYLNLTDKPSACSLFEGDYEVGRLMRAISRQSGTTVVPGETLIILDEIQESERALNSLKFLHERAPEYHVMAAGSLLGIALNRQHMSYPVGHVQIQRLFPMSFHEFLRALGEKTSDEILCEADAEMIHLMHDNLCSLFEEYVTVGGMPEVVKNYAQMRSGKTIRRLQNDIIDAYAYDFSKYSTKQQVTRIRDVWQCIPAQLARQSSKFTYSHIKEGARGRDYEAAIDWLNLCGLVHRVHRISKPEFPLPHYQLADAFKLFLSDTGLMSAMVNPNPETFLPDRSQYKEFKGALTEQCVCQMLQTSQPRSSLAYWSIPGNMAEVDFILQYDNLIIPIEVKAATNTQAKSLNLYCEKYAPKIAVRASLAHFGVRDRLLSLPLYMVEDLPSVLDKLL